MPCGTAFDHEALPLLEDVYSMKVTCRCRSYDVQVHPSDERIAAVILEIADFMLEFSTLGHEEAADIPQFVHPRIPNEVWVLSLP